MANETLKPVRGISGLFRNPRGCYVVHTSAKATKTGKLRKRKKTLVPGTTKDQAIAALAEVKAELRSGESLSPGGPIPTVRAYAPVWGERQLARGNWSANSGTAEQVGHRLDRYVIPHFGDHTVEHISYGDIERWLDWMGTQVSARTVKAAYGNLRGLIRTGRREHGLPSMDYPPAPKVIKDGKDEPLTWANHDKKDGVALTREQLGVFLRASKEISPHGWYPFSVLGFGSDARFSELACVRVEDLDLSGEVGIWLARRHLVSGQEMPGIKWDPRGTVRLLDAETTRILRPFVVGQHPEDLLFPSDQAGYDYRSNKGLQWFFDQVSKATTLPRMTSKVFRQTYITLGHLQIRADAMLQAQAGHSDPKTTMTYVRPSLEHRKQHARQMAQVLYAVEDG